MLPTNDVENWKADVLNKLTLPLVVLELVRDGQSVPQAKTDQAIIDLQAAQTLIQQIERGSDHV